MPEISIGGWNLIFSCLGGGIALAFQALFRAISVDVAKRITSTIWGIRMVDRYTPKCLHHHLWSGTWTVTWEVESNNFSTENSETGPLYRCFNLVAFEGSGTTATGKKIPYAFVGKLSQDGDVLTGTWFDRRGPGGYHGVYQLTVTGTGKAVSGLWAGFSKTGDTVKSGSLNWVRVS